MDFGMRQSNYHQVLLQAIILYLQPIFLQLISTSVVTQLHCLTVEVLPKFDS